MIRRLLLVNLALLAALGFLAWELRVKMAEAGRRERAMLDLRIPPAVVAPPGPFAKVAPIDAMLYQDVVAKNLFSRDRNPAPIPDPPAAPPPPPPVPPFPVARGVMLWEGFPATVVLSKKGSAEQRGYHVGDKMGDWTIGAIDNQYLTLEWNGREFKKRLDEMMDRTPIQTADAAAPAAPAAASAAPAPKSVMTISESHDGMGIDVGAGIRTCVAGDTQPPGTIVDGHKKVVSQTPFNTICRWEPVN